jgi:hypothetical protein
MQTFVHFGSIANPLKIVNTWFCSHLFVDPLKFQEHIGKIESYAVSPSNERPQDVGDFSHNGLRVSRFCRLDARVKHPYYL